jgi:ABC-type transport system involved in multi-copper enzyme maturation permease subunit
MNWLLWKDYRLHQLIFVVALAMLILPHSIAVIRGMPWNGEAFDFWTQLLASNLFVSSFVSLGVLQITLAMFGGNALACERVDRSAEFLAYLPINRRRMLASKLILVVGLAALVWLPNVAVLWAVDFECLLQPAHNEHAERALITIAVTGVVSFSVAWLASSMLPSPAIAVCLGLIGPLIPLFVAANVYTQEVAAYAQGAESDFFWWYLAGCGALAAICFPVGTVVYLRRMDP